MKLNNYKSLEAWFLNHDDPYYELAQDAASDSEAVSICKSALAEDNITYNENDLKDFVKALRSNEH